MSDLPYCSLMAKGHKPQHGWSFDPVSSLWVCDVCRKPSKANYLTSLPIDDRIMA